MATVELLFFPDCPNLPAARERLRCALEAVGAPPCWIEIDVTSELAPAHLRNFGSPTILIDGKDCVGAVPQEGLSCRVYADDDVQGVPSVEAIVAALRASSAVPSVGVASTLAVVPGALLSILPVVSCPSCWPAYAGILSSLGVPFLMDTAWLLPLTVVSLVLALGGLGFRAQHRRGFRPFLLGILASGGILLGKFVLQSDALVYTGTALLLVASLWNGWPVKQRVACPSCDVPVRG